MANIEINNISELNNSVLDLKSKVTSSLTNDINSINSILNVISNYSNNGFHANVGDIASKLKSNFNNILTNTKNSEENIFNYISYINKFNVDDYDTTASAVDLENQYNSLYLGIPLDSGNDDDNTNDNEPQKTKTNNTNTSNNIIDDSENNNTLNSTNSLETYLEKIDGKIINVNSNIETSAIVIDTSSENIYDAKTLAIINNANYDAEGFVVFNERYVISTTPDFGNIGDLIDIKQTDGTILKCIIGNIEQKADTAMINFVVNQNTFANSISTLHPNWLQSINSINNKGNYFDYINVLS